ncbi:hypothetical protein BVRB_9g204480 isoform B [Beta vulgaris subsp. vulgaris]|nr:hypothetical protein BVRB_9g204480 isoform B [Beta vulgaris subsp. vulgaris]
MYFCCSTILRQCFGGGDGGVSHSESTRYSNSPPSHRSSSSRDAGDSPHPPHAVGDFPHPPHASGDFPHPPHAAAENIKYPPRSRSPPRRNQAATRFSGNKLQLIVDRSFCLMDEIGFIGDNHPEDVRWLCSLSESELDMLISLKKLALQRARAVGHESLAQKFDLKMLRALGFVLMQDLKEKVNDSQLTGSIASEDLFDGCNLLKLDLEDRVETGEQAKARWPLI